MTLTVKTLFVAAATLLCAERAARAEADASSAGDATVIVGNNIAEEKQQIRDEVLGCGAGGGAASGALAVGVAGAVVALRRRGRPAAEAR